jgi:hypothetical protein
MTRSSPAHAKRVPDDGRNEAAWMALGFAILFLCVFVLYVISDL